MEHPENSSEYKGLTVNDGVAQPSIVNPYLNRARFKRRELSVSDMVEGIVKGNVTILSQAVTLIESVNPQHQAKAQEVIEKCLPYSGKSIRIGISGVPGAGKSTSIDEFGTYVLNTYGGKLAVLAIDPSSELSKGSILGDKTRMEKLSQHPKSFIRPSPSAGSLGGVARKTRIATFGSAMEIVSTANITEQVTPFRLTFQRKTVATTYTTQSLIPLQLWKTLSQTAFFSNSSLQSFVSWTRTLTSSLSYLVMVFLTARLLRHLVVNSELSRTR